MIDCNDWMPLSQIQPPDGVLIQVESPGGGFRVTTTRKGIEPFIHVPYGGQTTLLWRYTGVAKHQLRFW